MGSISTTPYVCQASRLPRMQFSIQCLCQQNCWPWSNVVWSLLSYCLQKWQKILYYHISQLNFIQISGQFPCQYPDNQLFCNTNPHNTFIATERYVHWMKDQPCRTLWWTSLGLNTWTWKHKGQVWMHFTKTGALHQVHHYQVHY